MKKKQTFPDLVWQFFCSVKLSVYLLILLAATSIVGTVILQNGTEQEYLRLYGPTYYNLIKIFDFHDMYHAWWFLGLIVLLCINIIVCSIDRLSITWKTIFPKEIAVRPDRFLARQPMDSFLVETGLEQAASRIRPVLERHIGKVRPVKTENGTGLYSETGRWTRIGVYIVHSSILLLLVGALIGVVFGFKADLRLDEGQTLDTAFLSKTRLPVKLPFAVRCNDFEVKFYDTGAPEEFRSNLTLIENSSEVMTKDIRVNHPLRYKGINIFQASYGTASPDSVHLDIIKTSDKSVTHLDMEIGQEIELPDAGGKLKLEGFLPHFSFRSHNLGEAFIFSVMPLEGEAFQIGLPIKFPTFDKMRKGTFAFVIKEFDQKFYTGLQVTKDPGIWYVYAGFALMIIGCWVTFFMSFRTCFVEIISLEDESCKISVYGKTNRNRHGYKLRINKMITQLKD